ncbi:MAG: carboxylesterase family protein [Firmicutes bacterium]|nr:carboxylesterase family protein [Bacillota bacterium]
MLLPKGKSRTVNKILAAVVMIVVSCSSLNLVQASKKEGTVRYPDVVRIESGLLSGVAGVDPAVMVFKGIPYAAPPVGNLRWRPPQPPAAWQGVRKADKFGAICPQFTAPKGSFYQLEYYPEEEPQSEDCLYLNVWTSAKTSKERRPVMVWIHGGGFVQGQGSLPSFNGEELAKKGIIVVTINYRLGVFGHLAHPDLTGESGANASGNYALLDQIAALKWVQKNIAAFGGDPNQVTLAGQSAGSFNIHYLMMSDMAKGLFQQAILESGGIGANYRFPASLAAAEQTGVKYAKMHGVETIQELRAVPTEELLGNMMDYLKWGFSPIVDGQVLSDSMIHKFVQGKQNNIPLLIGFNANEATSLLPNTYPVQVFKQEAQSRYGDKTEQFLQLYPAESDEQSLQAKIASMTDSYAATAYYLSRLNAADGSKAYLYCFDRRLPGRNSDYYGAFHSAEIEYAFNTLHSTGRPWEEQDWKLASLMSAYWANFVKTSNPNGAGLPLWQAYEAQSDMLMELGNQVQMQKVPRQDKLNYLMDILKAKLDEH